MTCHAAHFPTTIVFVLLLFFCINTPLLSSAKTYDGILENPVALGAWLYLGNCTRCHENYDNERLATDYDNKEELILAIGSDACKVTWSRNRGGTLGNNELQALAEFMLKWEEGNKQPSLPKLPPQPLMRSPELPQTKLTVKPLILPPQEEEVLSLPLKKLIASNSVVEGGFLYTRNCYRCHLTYKHGRMGKGVDKQLVQRYISEGKTSTQMKAFSRILGGNLKNSEIRSIVSYITTWEKKGEQLAIADTLMTPPALDPVDFVPIRLPRFKPVSGDSVAGNLLFRKNCTICHGLDGEGYIGSSLQGKRAVMRPDLFLKSVIKQGIPKSLMKGWDVGNGGSFSARDIDDVVSTILSWMGRDNEAIAQE